MTPSRTALLALLVALAGCGDDAPSGELDDDPSGPEVTNLTVEGNLGPHAPSEEFVLTTTSSTPFIDGSGPFHDELSVAVFIESDSVVTAVRAETADAALENVMDEAGADEAYRVFLGPSALDVIEWTFRCGADGGRTTVRFEAVYINDEDTAPYEQAVEVDCTGGGRDTDDSADPPTTEGSSTSGPADESSSSSGSGGPDPAGPIHVYVPTDSEPLIYAYLMLDGILNPAPTPTIELSTPAVESVATSDGGAIYFGGDELHSFARDQATGELTRIDDAITRDWRVGAMGISGDDDRIFVADENVTQPDISQYAIGGDYGLTAGADFTVGLYTRYMITDPSGDHFFGTYIVDGGGLVTGELGTPDDVPTVMPFDGGWTAVGGVGVNPSGECLFVSASAGLSGARIYAYAIEADGGLTEAGFSQGGGLPLVTSDDAFLVTPTGGAEGRLTVRPRTAGCGLGKELDSVDAPLGAQRYSNLLQNGDGDLLLEFSASGAGRAIEVTSDGTLEVGPELELPQGVRSMVILEGR